MTETVTHLLPPAPFGRVIPAMITSMNKDGSVDYGAAANLAWTLVADGADALLFVAFPGWGGGPLPFGVRVG